MPANSTHRLKTSCAACRHRNRAPRASRAHLRLALFSATSHAPHALICIRESRIVFNKPTARSRTRPSRSILRLASALAACERSATSRAIVCETLQKSPVSIPATSVATRRSCSCSFDVAWMASSACRSWEIRRSRSDSALDIAWMASCACRSCESSRCRSCIQSLCCDSAMRNFSRRPADLCSSDSTRSACSLNSSCSRA